MFGYRCFPSLGPPGGLVKLREEHWCGDDPGDPVLRLFAPDTEGPGSLPGQGTRSHMPQQRFRMLQLTPSAAK